MFHFSWYITSLRLEVYSSMALLTRDTKDSNRLYNVTVRYYKYVRWELRLLPGKCNFAINGPVS